MYFAGQSAGAITLEILADDLPETDEELTVTLTRVEPDKTQMLRQGSTEVKVVILENDNAGGVFQFGSEAQRSYVVEVGSFFFLRLIEDSSIRQTAGRKCSCELRCPKPPSLRYKRVEDTRWPCGVRSGLQRHRFCRGSHKTSGEGD